MDQDVPSPRPAVADGPRDAVSARPDVGPGRGGRPLVPPPAERARYQPLRGLEELLDDFLGRAG